MIEAPIQITDEYVRNYLWEHNLVAIDEGDLRRLKQPTKLLVIPELMERAGWVRKKEWQGLTGQETNHLLAANADCAEKLIRAIEAKLKEKNNA